MTAPDRVESYASVPAGTFRCRVAEVRVSTTRAGAERWTLRLMIADGDLEGRMAAWHPLVFNEASCIRSRRVLSALGLTDPTVEPTDLEERTAIVRIVIVDHVTAQGVTVRRNEVAPDGLTRDEGGSK